MPEDPVVTDAAAETGGASMLERLRRVLETAQRLTRERATREAEATASWREAEGAARAAYDEAARAQGQAAADAEARAEQALQDELARIEAEVGRPARAARAAFEAKSREILRRAADAIAKVKAAGRDAAWMNETVFESDHAQAAARVREARALAEARRARLAEAEATLASAERTFNAGAEHAAAAPEAVGPAAPEGPPPAPAEALLPRVEEEASGLDRMWAHTALERSVFVLAVGGLGLGGAAAGWLLDGLRLGVGAAAGVAVGAALGVGAGVGIRRLASRAGRKACARLRAMLAEASRAVTSEAAAGERAFDDATRSLETRRDRELQAAGRGSAAKLSQIERDRDAALESLAARSAPELDRLEADAASREAAARDGAEARRRTIREGRASALTESAASRDRAIDAAREARDEALGAMRDDWLAGLAWLRGEAEALASFDAAHWPRWDEGSWAGWAPPADAPMAARIASVGLDLGALEGGLPEAPSLSPAGPTSWTLPVALETPRSGSLLVKFGRRTRSGDAGDGRAEAVGLLRAAMLRYLTCLPPGKARFTVIDPVSLGQDFAGFMHLADYNEAFITHRIWTEPKHIEQRLTELTEHMEGVIQSYLRNQFETIAEYNEHAGEIAEPYRLLVVSGFPIGFDEAASRRLASIVASGPRCGVYTLIALDRREDVPNGVSIGDLEAASLTLSWTDGRFLCEDEVLSGWRVEPDAPPSEDVLTTVVRAVGDAGQDATRVEAPFEVVAPGTAETWTGDSARDLAAPLGRAGATKLQRMVLGRGTAQHVLIAGRTGSGKSTLLHVLITNLALWYGPDQVEMYLVDFKKGVEFKTYAEHDLPHARAVAIESDREFGLSVLQRVDAELKRRGDLFREHSVQDLAGFREAAPGARMPRTLLVIDEFQELFVEDDKIASDAALVLDRLVRQGRAFGVHVVLGSQTLAGAYTLARSTMGQMGVRIALQCSEADSYLIMSEDNGAARLLSRPGEAIYNDASGLVEGNSPFQIVWLPEAKRERALTRIRELADRRPAPGPDGWGPPAIVFEGNAPADLARNGPLRAILASAPPEAPPAGGASAWFGDAVAIKDPTSARLARQSGANVLIVTQQEPTGLGVTMAGVVGLGPQHPVGGALFYIVDPSTPADAWDGVSERVAGASAHDARVVRPEGLAETLGAIAAEIEGRAEAGGAGGEPSVYLVLLAAQRLRDLRREDDYGFSMDDDGAAPKPDKLLAQILRDGPPMGVHVIMWCDTLSAAERLLDRPSMREFDGRVLTQMSSSDSTALIDTPAASRLGPHRALFYSEETGEAEVFRPYRAPNEATLAALRRG